MCAIVHMHMCAKATQGKASVLLLQSLGAGRAMMVWLRIKLTISSNLPTVAQHSTTQGRRDPGGGRRDPGGGRRDPGGGSVIHVGAPMDRHYCTHAVR